MTEAQDKLQTETPVPQTSRRGLLIGAGVAAAGAGLGVAWWESRTLKKTVSEPVDGFWSMHWDTPQGSVLRMDAFRDKPVLINFWATWCPPCIEELPLINAFYQQNKAKGWGVIGLAVDKPSSVQAFLKRAPLDFPIGLAGLSGGELGRSLGNLAGGLPFSVVLGADGNVAQRKIGKVSVEDLQAWATLK